MANISGARLTSNITDRLVIDMAKDIALLDPKVAPFITLLKRIKSGGGVRVAHSPKFEWLEDDYLQTTDAVNGAVAANATSVTVDNGGLFRVNDVINVPSTGENMRITAISGNVLTVYGEGASGVVKSAIADNAVIVNLGPAMAENATSRARLTTNVTNVSNYTQIFRTPVELSGTAENSEFYGGPDRAYQRRKALSEHKLDIARSVYFGKPLQNAITAQRTMGGLVNFIGADHNGTTVTFNEGDLALNYKNFNATVAKAAFEHGSDKRLLVCGPNLAAAIDSWDIGAARTTMKEEDTYGVHVTRLITSYGVMNVVYDPLLSGAYAGYGFALDMDNIRYVHLKNRDTKLRTNIQPNDQDGVMDEYLTECSLEVKLPKTHVLIKGAYI